MDDFRVVRETASESAIWTLVASARTWFESAWRHSWLRRLSTATIGPMRSWSVEAWVRSIAATLATAGIVNVLLVSAATRYAAPGIPRAAVACASILAAVVAAAPAAFVAAWPDSAIGRAVTALARTLYKTAE